MKLLIYAILQCWVIAATAQQTAKPNVFIITTDGLRWQEVFNGADEKILIGKMSLVTGSNMTVTCIKPTM